MTAMRVAQDHDPSTFGMKQNESAGVFRNPASSYQTATPQQLHAAGIQPLVRNDRNVGHLNREKSATLNSFPVYNSNSGFADQHLVGQNRSYNYDDLNAQQGQHSASPAAGVYRGNNNSSNNSNNNGSMYHPHGQQQQVPSAHRGGVPQINSVEVSVLHFVSGRHSLTDRFLPLCCCLLYIGCQRNDSSADVNVRERKLL